MTPPYGFPGILASKSADGPHGGGWNDAANIITQPCVYLPLLGASHIYH